MDSIAFPTTGIDLPTLVADAMVDSGAFDSLVEGIGRALKSVPKRVAVWLGPELHSPDNSAAPSVSFAGSELFNGVVFIESNEPSYWLLVKASVGRCQQRHNQPPPFTGRDPYGQPDHRWPHEPSGTRGFWPEVSPCEPPPWEGDPWRR